MNNESRGLTARAAACLSVFALVSIIVFSISSCTQGGKELPIVKKASDFALINQDGETIQLSNFQGSVKFIGFIYIRCNMARMCPLTTKNFKRLQGLFSEDQAQKVELMLITFDPDHDTPGALKRYGEIYGADFSNWHFLTGSKEDIDAVCEDYSIIHEEQENGMIRHSMMAYLIDQKNNIRKIYFGNDWDPLSVKIKILSLMN